MDPTNSNSTPDSLAAERAKDADNRLAALSTLLSSIDDSARRDAFAESRAERRFESQLAQARLGMASSLFVALRAKHAHSAAHCLRVALGLSSWAMTMELPDEQRDMFEVAALLHDVGKVGVPDHVLLKPGKLSGEELLLMERHRQFSGEILSGCCSSPELLNIVHYAPAWYDGGKHGFDRSGEDLPLGSRMIAIVDAFDAMTTDHVYRKARSREQALGELFEHAGRQFDPKLVQHFCGLASTDKVQFTAGVSRRWLQQLEATSSNRFWGCEQTSSPSAAGDRNSPFHERLLASMHDGVIFVDGSLQITMWNCATERMTGIKSESVTGQLWIPSLVNMSDEDGQRIADEECPVVHTMRSGAQSLRRISITGRNRDRVSVDMHVAPVMQSDGVARGATIILHDASSQITLEERVQTLHEKATRDPLTKIANRAEFDRLLPQFVETHLVEGVSCSMVMCDIDHFKQINDTHGHQAGDEALVLFAGMLQSHARGGDLVARYGGEEFVILCADCNNATATQRAEELRRHISEQTQPSLGNRCMTASFGVTEIQGGDTAETFLNRADRALLQAKDSGRNLVVQLGTGIGESDKSPKAKGWFKWFNSQPGEELLSRNLITIVPLKVAGEKLRGFVADHHAQIVDIADNVVTLRIDGQNMPLTRRQSDRAVPFLIELTFDEQADAVQGRSGGAQARTIIQVVIRPKRQRDRRRGDVIERARQLLVSLKSYLMAHDYTEAEKSVEERDGRDDFLRRSKQILTYWLHE
jgi:diguanylate cyclase (GGDEF)-like protein/PAS domain S-box-containing protein